MFLRHPPYRPIVLVHLEWGDFQESQTYLHVVNTIAQSPDITLALRIQHIIPLSLWAVMLVEVEDAKSAASAESRQAHPITT